MVRYGSEEHVLITALDAHNVVAHGTQRQLNEANSGTVASEGAFV